MTNCGFVFVSTLTGRASCTRKRPRATALWRAQLWTGWLWSPSAAPWPPGPTGRNKAAARCTQSPSGGWTLPSPPPQSYPDGHFSFLCARKKVKKAFLPLYLMSGAPSAAEVSAPNPLCPESERASERKAGRRSQVGKCVTLIELCKALSSRGAVYRFALSCRVRPLRHLVTSHLTHPPAGADQVRAPWRTTGGRTLKKKKRKRRHRSQEEEGALYRFAQALIYQGSHVRWRERKKKSEGDSLDYKSQRHYICTCSLLICRIIG